MVDNIVSKVKRLASKEVVQEQLPAYPQAVPKVIHNSVCNIPLTMDETDVVEEQTKSFLKGLADSFRDLPPPAGLRHKSFYTLGRVVGKDTMWFARPMRQARVTAIAEEWLTKGWHAGTKDYAPPIPDKIDMRIKRVGQTVEEAEEMILGRFCWRNGAMLAWEHIGKFRTSPRPLGGDL